MASLKDRIPEKKKVDELKKILTEKFHAGGFFSKPAPVPVEPGKVDDEKKVEALKNLIQEKTLAAKQGEAQTQAQTHSQPTVSGAQTIPASPKTPGPKQPKGEGFSPQGFFKSLEDKWYDFLDKVDEHVPVYNVIDKIDEFVPSFYVFLGIILLIILLLLFFVAGPVVTSLLTPEYSFLVVDESGNPVAGASAAIVSAGQTFGAVSRDDGSFSIKLPDSFVEITVSKDGFETYSSPLGLVAGQENKIILKQKILSFIKKNVEVYFEERLFEGSVRLTFFCSNASANAPARLTINDGVARDISFPENCGNMSVMVEAQGFETQTLSFGSESTLLVYLQSGDSLAGSVKVTLVSADSGDAVLGASVALYDDRGIAQDSVLSSDSGIAMFEGVVPGNYYVQVSQARGFEETDSAVFQVRPREQFSFTLELDPLGDGVIKKIFLKFVDAKTSKPIEGVRTWLVVNDNVLPPEYASDEEGFVAIRGLSGTQDYAFIAAHSDYILFVEDDPAIVDEDSQTYTTVRLLPSEPSNSVTAVVEVFDGVAPVEGALAVLYNEDYNFSIAWENTNAEGKVRFEGLPAGTYHAFAQIEGEKEGTSQPKTGAVGETITLRINLSLLAGGLKVVVRDSSGGAVRDANVFIHSHPDGALLESTSTNSSGETPDFNFSVDSTVYAVVSKPGFVTVQSEAKKILADIVQTIPVELVAENGFDPNSPHIEFMRVENLSSNPVSGYLEDSHEYYLKFRLFVPENTRDGNAVVFLENEFLRFVLTEIGGGFNASYFNCGDQQNPYAVPGCEPVNPNPDTPDTKQLRLGFGRVPSQFYVFRVKANIPVVEGTPEASAFYGMKVFNVFNEPKSDPANDLQLHEEVFRINEPIECRGAPEECPVFGWSVDVFNSDGSLVPFDRPNNKYVLDVDNSYDMNVKLANLSDTNDFTGLSFTIADPSASDSLSIGQRGSYAYTSAPFALPHGTDYRVDSIDLYTEKSGTVSEKFELLGVNGQTPALEFLFEIQEQASLELLAEPDSVRQGSEQQNVEITVTDSSNGSPVVNGASVAMVKSQGEPLPEAFNPCAPPDCVTVPVSPDSGTARFAIPGPHERGVSYWFKATANNYPDSGILEVPVYGSSASFGPELGCVVVCPGTENCTETPENISVLFGAGETQKPSAFTVRSSCEEEVSITFSKLTALEPYPEVRPAQATLERKGFKTFGLYIDGAECPESAVQDSLCPGEYRVYVSAQTDSQESFGLPPSRIGKVRFFKLPESDPGHCFELCKGGACFGLQSYDSTAVFDVDILKGDGVDEFNVQNKCVPPQPKNSLAYLKTQLSACSEEAGDAACTDWQLAKEFAKVEFTYRLVAVVNGNETQGTVSYPVVSLFELSPQEIGELTRGDDAADAYINSGSEAGASLRIDVENVLVTGPGSENFKDTVDAGKIEGSFMDIAPPKSYTTKLHVALRGIGDPTSLENEGKVINNSLLSDTAALFRVFDHVPIEDAGEGGFLPVTFTVKLEAKGTVECKKDDFGPRTAFADNTAQEILGTVREELSECIGNGEFNEYEASIVGDPTCPPSYNGDCPSVFLSFDPDNPNSWGETAVTQSAEDKLSAKVSDGVTTFEGKNYQLIFLADTSGSVDDEWNKFCGLTSGALKEKLGSMDPPREVVSTHVFAMGDRENSERTDVECNGKITYVPWSDKLVGEEAGYSKVGETELTGENHGVQCKPGSQCDPSGDAEQESWAPIMHTIVRLFNGEITECPEGLSESACEAIDSANRFAGSGTTTIFVVVNDSDPTGMRKSDDGKTVPSDWRDGEKSEKYVVDQLVEKITSVDQEEKGDLRFYLIYGNHVEAPDLKSKWPGGDSEKNDVVEAMEYFAQEACSDAQCSAVANLDLENISVEELADKINDFIEEIDNTNVREEIFHVILEAGDDAVCYGPNNRQGISGKNAVSSLRRSFDWTWNSGFTEEGNTGLTKSFCNPTLSDGTQNRMFVYCDSAQFTQMVLNRILLLAEGQDYRDWQQTEGSFSSELIRDGLTSSFLVDFKDWALEHQGGIGRKIPSGLFGSMFDLEAYVDNERIKFIVIDEDRQEIGNKILPSSGLYQVEIDVDFDDRYSTLMDNDGMPAADITITLTETDPLESSDNLFYFLPFDGEIGLGANRDGYGVSYAVDEENKIILFRFPDGEVIETLPNTTGGIVEISVDKVIAEEAFSALNAVPSFDTRGMVLSLTEKGPGQYDLVFTPSFASPIMVRVDKPQNSLDAEAAFYLTGVGDQKIETGMALPNWFGVASNVDSCYGFDRKPIERGIPTLYNQYDGFSCRGLQTGDHGFDRPVDTSLEEGSYSNVFASVVYTLDRGASLSMKGCGGAAATIGESDWSANTMLVSLPSGEIFPLATVQDVFKGVGLSYFDNYSEDSVQGDYCMKSGLDDEQNKLEIWFNESNMVSRFVSASTQTLFSQPQLGACFGS